MTETFDPALFDRLKEAEKSHFWFLVRKKWIFDEIRKFKKTPSTVLEIGCGAGNVSSYLSDKGYHVIGCEYYKEAIDAAWHGFDKVRGDANALPFLSSSFDIVGLFDVIEHFGQEHDLLIEAYRVLKEDGILVITVPARSELWSYFDEISFHKRRYSTKVLLSALKGANFKSLSAKYMFMMLYFPMQMFRGKSIEASNLFKIGNTLNLLSMLYFEVERFISRFFKLPIGTSIIVVAKK